MKTAFLILALALAVGSATASCPNSCSGHGTCGQYDKCSCWANWQGNDCGQRTCAYGDSWALNNVDPHYYDECSSKGICDRSTGECQCFPEFEGRACERLSCPNQCSGHGKCRYLNDMSNPSTYSGWDKIKIQTCMCDGGFYGPDCSQRYCPQGDDPLTVCNNADTQIQRLALRFDTFYHDIRVAGYLAESVENDELALKFTDTHGEVWKTQRISSIWTNTTAITNIENALEALPNWAIPSVTVTIDSDNDDDEQKAYLITFSDARTSGDQSLITCHDDPLGCMSAGCQPKYKQPRIVEEFVDVFANIGKIQMTDDSVLTHPSRGAAGRNWNYDANITIQIHDNSSDSTENYFSYASAQVYNTYTTFIQTATDAVSELEGGFQGAIPIDYQRVYIGYGMYVRFSGRKTSAGRYTFGYSTPTCSVVQTRASAANNENAECSNRGDCDDSTGLCACYDGFYGHNCESQTILV